MVANQTEYSRFKQRSVILFTNPSARAGYNTKSVFKQSLTGLNSEVCHQIFGA